MILPMAAPSRRHQKISSFLHGNLYIFFEKHLCDVYAAPFDVRLFDKNKSIKANKDIFTVIQPDICVVCDESKLDDAGCLGSPDVIIEILLLGNSKKEMKIKKDLYEENGVREYWIFDPEHESALKFVLSENNLYETTKIYSNEDILDSSIFEGLQINLEKLFVY